MGVRGWWHLINLNMNEINKPQQTTYFIAYDEDKSNPSFGSIEPEQVMTSGRSLLFQTTDKAEWEAKLSLDFGIVIEN